MKELFALILNILERSRNMKDPALNDRRHSPNLIRS